MNGPLARLRLTAAASQKRTLCVSSASRLHQIEAPNTRLTVMRSASEPSATRVEAWAMGPPAAQDEDAVNGDG